MQWHRNCRSVIKAVRPARLGNWKMDDSTSRGVICMNCQDQIDGGSIAISATEYMCSDCWHLILLGPRINHPFDSFSERPPASSTPMTDLTPRRPQRRGVERRARIVGRTPERRSWDRRRENDRRATVAWR